ncbi:MAG: tetratricopeptide repeat protein [Candidatus Tantalella remota]|nr:tetratricopeptide repeat protein [Candidatus Tantalella remota]
MIKTDGNTRFHIVCLFLLVVVCAAIFSNTLGNSFVWDDKEAIVEDQYLQNIRYIPSLFSPEYWRHVTYRTKGIYRPLVATSYSVDFAFWKNDPKGYHLTNLILHTACTLLIYALMCLLTMGQKELRRLPLLSAMLFAAHPVHVEAVTWVKNRSDLLGGVFFILAVICFVVFIRHKKTRSLWIFYPLSLVAYVCALGSKQSALPLPLILILYVLCFMPRDNYKSGITAALPFFAMTAGFLCFKISALGLLVTKEALQTAEIGFYSNILAIPKTLGCYLRLLAFPVNLSAERLFIAPDSALDPSVLLSTALILILLAAGVWTFRRYRILSFSIFWIFLTLLPVSNILFLYGRPVAEQRLYLPSVGFCVILAFGIIRLLSTRGRHMPAKVAKFAAVEIFLLIFVPYCLITFVRNRDWKNPQVFWEDVIRRSPHSSRAYNNLGIVYSNAGQVPKAIPLFQKAIELNRLYENPLNNLGVIYGTSGDFPSARDHFQKALLINPSNMDSYINLANTYYVSGQTDRAIQLYEKSMSLNPYRGKAYDNLSIIYDKLGRYEDALRLHKTQLLATPYSSEIHTNLGKTYMALESYPEAAEAFRQAIKLDPDNAVAYADLGILAGKMNNNMESLTLFKKALQLDPSNAKNYVNLGISYQQTGEIDKAISSYKKAIEQDPSYPDAYNNLGVLYGMRGRNEESLKLFMNVVEIDPDNANAYVNIAHIFNSRGNFIGALSAMKKAASLEPANKPVYDALFKQYQDIISQYKEKLRTEPENTAVLFTLGTIYHESGEYDKALETYQRILKIDPSHARAYYTISLLYFDREMYEKASEYAGRAKALGFSNPAYLEALKQHQESRE